MTPEDTHIFNAITNGSNELAESLIDIAEQQNPTADTNKYLHWSIESQNTSMTLHLLLKGYNPNISNSIGLTPLMLAVTSKNEDLVKILLDAGVDIDLLTLRSILESNHATENILRLVLENLRERCGTIQQTAQRLFHERCRLDQAALLRDSRVIERMLQLQNVPTYLVHWSDGRRPLKVAARLGDVETVRLLLRYGAHMTVGTEGRKETALKYIHLRESRGTGKLLDEGMSPMECTWGGGFTVGPTLMEGRCGVVKLLLRSGIDWLARDTNSERTVLHYLAMNLLKSYVKKFVITAVDGYKTTPLYHSVTAGNVEVLRFLLENGAEVECRHSIQKYSPLYKAYMERYSECAKLLLRYNADPQYIVDGRYAKTTIFDVARDDGEVEPVVAQLAVMERFGGKISDVIRNKIDSKRLLKKYLKRCRKMLGRKVAGEVMTSGKRKLARYVRREESLRKVKYMRYRRRLKRSYSYYYESIKKSITKTYRCIGAREVLCELFKGGVDSSNIVIDKLVGYLDDNSGKSLYDNQLYERRSSQVQFEKFEVHPSN